MKSGMKKRIRLFLVIIILIILGLLSRKIRILPDSVGDALCAMMIYCCWRIVLLKKERYVSALAALVTSYAVEFSQLLTMDWLVRIRSTFLGHMLLGQGFLWSDLAAYAAGIAVIFLLTTGIEDRNP